MLFQKVCSNDKKNSKKPPFRFTKRYPFRPPLHTELGGWYGTVTSLVLCVGIDIKSGANNECFLQPDGVFVWTDQARAKVDNNADTWMRFLVPMLQLFYTLMIGKDASIDGTLFQQYIGPMWMRVHPNHSD